MTSDTRLSPYALAHLAKDGHFYRPDSGHRLTDLYRSGKQTPELDRYLRLASEDLKATIAFTKQNELPYFSDMTNRLFATLPLPNQVNERMLSQGTAAYDELSNRLKLLNERMVVANFDHLREIRSVVAIAGGPFKIQALWTLLVISLIEPSKRTITELTTDAESASTLIAALEQYKDADSTKRRWYESVAKRIL